MPAPVAWVLPTCSTEVAAVMKTDTSMLQSACVVGRDEPSDNSTAVPLLTRWLVVVAPADETASTLDRAAATISLDLRMVMSPSFPTE